ncbi:hypothetical protein [Geosporobacter ferrireducens]|uniref:DUF4367 domain-containing protein n=1 Tax=Geosporobacter ferrireducens TaxID=1424294 RepID=A0A1D8GG96_9FIRM|nr:hypothetical protein [Geosporobacter ferrireducens]AOT69942.1 hypothetical protein Gferi_10310 [Geosporobacter ferrireducens]MTI54362.1 hypothetical protein [Geosporobacter ferrireducens]
MINRQDLDAKIKSELAIKAKEAELSDEMFEKIIKRIGTDTPSDDNTWNTGYTKILIKRWIAVSLCGILAFTGILLTFSVEVRALALEAANTIKTIFVLEKQKDEYKIVEKPDTDEIFKPIVSRGSGLSEAELTEKLGFHVHFPETLCEEYTYERKSEGVGITKPVNAEEWKQLQWVMIRAIADEDTFNHLSDYKPYRDVHATYMDQRGDKLFITMEDADVPIEEKNIVLVAEPKVGSVKAAWIEETYPDYKFIYENGIGQSDIYTEPEGIIKGYYLIWSVNGVRYRINTLKEFELTMEEAVKIAKAFMEGLKTGKS